MGADVTLVIKADTSNAVKGVKDLQKATQDLYNYTTQGAGKATGVIEKEELVLKRLQDWKRKASFEDLKYYNQAIDQSRKRLEAYENEGKAIEESGKKAGGVGASFLKWATSVAAVTAALGFLKSAMESTNRTADKLAEMTEGVRQGFEAIKRAVATLDFKDFIKNVKAAYEEGARYARTIDQLDDATRALRMREAEIGVEILKQTKIQRDALKSKDEQIAAGREIIRLEEELAEVRTGIAQKAYDNELQNIASITHLTTAEVEAYAKQEPQILANIKLGEDYNKVLEEYSDLAKKAATSRGQLGGEDKKRLDELQFIINGTTEAVKRFAYAQDKLVNDAKMDLLVDKYQDLQEAIGSAMQNTMRSGARLSSTIAKDMKQSADEVEQFFKEWERETLIDIEKRDKMLKQAAEEERKERERTYKFNLELGKYQFENDKKLAKAEYDLRIKNAKDLEDAEQKALELKKENWIKGGELILDFISILDELSQREVDYYERQRELLDTRIDETQSSLDSEIELYKAGYASNVAAKQKELEDLKKARAKALKDEELARKKEHTLKVAALLAQKAIDVAKVISSSAVAKAEAYAMMGNPITAAAGLALLTATRISQAISIAAISAAVIAASVSKFAKGGWTGDGKYRDETGERMAGVVHEKEFVVRKGPAHKFRDVLEAINRDDKRAIYDSFNKLSPEILGGTTVNHVVVENEGPNKRLDQVNAQLRQLNRKQSREDIQEYGNIKIVRKGNSTRIISR